SLQRVLLMLARPRQTPCMRKKFISQFSSARCSRARTLGGEGGFCSYVSIGLFLCLAGVLVAFFTFAGPTGALQAQGAAHQSNNWANVIKIMNPVSPQASGTWTVTGSLNAARFEHTATLLLNGMVLVAGGGNGTGNTLASAELYDPASGRWTGTGSLNIGRSDHTATLLPNSTVLAAGGFDDNFSPSSSAELYDPASGSWTATGDLNSGRYFHTATLLPNGTALVAAGVGSTGVFASAELYDPANGSW